MGRRARRDGEQRGLVHESNLAALLMPDSLLDLRTGAEAIANGAVKGQVHFFPAICNAKQITDEFARRGCGKL